MNPNDHNQEPRSAEQQANIEDDTMYFKDGFVYGGEPEEMIALTSVKIMSDGMMLVTFNNGEVRLFDSSVLVGPVFEPLRDESILRNCVIDHGVPTWCDGAIDCAPEFIYDHSFEYALPSGTYCEAR